MTVVGKRCILGIHEAQIYASESLIIYHCGDDSGEVPPVLIPNTEVKLTSADNTLLETAREDRLLLHPLKKHSSNDGCFFLLYNLLLIFPPTAALLDGKKSQFIRGYIGLSTLFNLSCLQNETSCDIFATQTKG